MLAFAETVVTNASRVSRADIDRLHGADFTDTQICDIGLRASLRCFMSRFYDATGALRSLTSSTPTRRSERH